MGQTLTGTTPQDTYEALIKVGDNGIITGSLKTLSDGEGHDTALALSTGAASVTGTLAVTAGTNLATASGSVGIGTAAPAAKLDIVGTSGNTQLNVTSGSGTFPFITLDQTGVVKYAIQNVATTGLFTITEAGVGDRLVIAKTSGNVGIGTSAPARALHVKSGTGTAQIESTTTSSSLYFADSSTTTIDNQGIGSVGNSITIFTAGLERVRVTANGLTFNGDTAAANALDDYEEGTFTPSLAFGGASVDMTYFDRQGNYTKIGRQVTCTMYIALTAIGSSTGNATITGLPFTCANLNRGTVGAPSFRFASVTFSGQLTGSVPNNNNIIELTNTTLLGVQTALTNANFSSASEFNAITVTYFSA